MTPEQALANLESISKAWLGSLGAEFDFEKAAVAQTSVQTLKVALKPEIPKAKSPQKSSE